jgi:uncharacterized membrane protein (DUF485 family)
MNESDRAEPRHTGAGLVLFVVYVFFYAGFVALAAFARQKMETQIGGVNVAILYGFGLIILAFVLALVYMRLTRIRSGDGESRA